MTTETEGNLEEGSAEPTESLRDELASAFEASEKAETNPLSEAGRTLASGRGKSEEVAPTGTDTVVKGADTTPGAKGQDTQAGATATDTLEAPQHWPAADREMFAKQTPDAKTWLLNRHKAMEADYTRKTQDLRGIGRFKEQLDEIMAPYREAMARDGVDDAHAIRQLVGVHTYLMKDPQNAIQWVAEKYGIDLKSVSTESAATSGQLPPAFTKLQETVTQLEKRLHDEAQRTQQQEHNARLHQVEQFATEKDAQGQLRRPHFDEVAGDVVALLRGSQASGQQMTLQDAYDRAVYANPQTRAKVLAATDAQRKAKEDEERKTKANAARKAGFDVKGEGAASPGAVQSNSVRAELESAWNAAEGRL